VRWARPDGEPPDWTDSSARALAFTLHGRDAGEPPLQVLLNLGSKSCAFALPRLPGWSWGVAVDTAAHSPGDLVEPRHQRGVAEPRFRVAARAVLVLEGIANALAD
jgi:glycogen operon protein